MLQMFEQKKTKNMKDALGRTGGAIPKRREPESCQPIIFLVITTSQQIFLGAHNNIFSGSHFETWIFNVWTQPR